MVRVLMADVVYKSFPPALLFKVMAPVPRFLIKNLSPVLPVTAGNVQVAAVPENT